MATISFQAQCVIWLFGPPKRNSNNLPGMSVGLGQGFKGLVVTWPDDDVIKWKHFPRYWPFVQGFHRSRVNSPHKGQWRGALIFSLICVWIKDWVNNREAGCLRRYRAHYDTSVMWHAWLHSRTPVVGFTYLPTVLFHFTLSHEVLVEVFLKWEIA